MIRGMTGTNGGTIPVPIRQYIPAGPTVPAVCVPSTSLVLPQDHYHQDDQRQTVRETLQQNDRLLTGQALPHDASVDLVGVHLDDTDAEPWRSMFDSDASIGAILGKKGYGITNDFHGMQLCVCVCLGAYLSVCIAVCIAVCMCQVCVVCCVCVSCPSPCVVSCAA